jgi:hypothetical protein
MKIIKCKRRPSKSNIAQQNNTAFLDKLSLLKAIPIVASKAIITFITI